MPITIKKKLEIEKMRADGKLAAKVLNFIEPFIKPGISTNEIDRLCAEFIAKNKAIAAPLNYKGFPKSVCTSVNNVVCHGIPDGQHIIADGDIINVDVTVILDGFHGDTSRTFLVGNVSKEVKDLVETTYKAMMKGIKAIRPGKPLDDVGTAIENFINSTPYTIVEDFGGHGIGRIFHEEPFVANYRTGRKKPLMQAGMTFTVEPMINMGDPEIVIDSTDGWTVTTLDKSLSAQFEHTVLVTNNGFEILTIE